MGISDVTTSVHFSPVSRSTQGNPSVRGWISRELRSLDGLKQPDTQDRPSSQESKSRQVKKASAEAQSTKSIINHTSESNRPSRTADYTKSEALTVAALSTRNPTTRYSSDPYYGGGGCDYGGSGCDYSGGDGGAHDSGGGECGGD